MIPGKVFFQSIDVPQRLARQYEFCLIMNGIFYDSIKPFQSKYVCLTANDVLEVELGLKLGIGEREGEQMYRNEYLSDITNVQEQQQDLPQMALSYMKVSIPQAYKIVIESKTIEIKFQLNRKNNHQQIKINLAFQPVSTFSRKKLGATLNSNKSAFKNTTQFNQHQLQKLSAQHIMRNQIYRQEQSSLFGESPERYLFQKMDAGRKKNQHSSSPVSSQERRSLEKPYERNSRLSSTMGRRSHIESKDIGRIEDNPVKEVIKSVDKKFNYLPPDIIIEDESSSSVKYFNSTTKQLKMNQTVNQPKPKNQPNHRNPSSLNQTSNIQMLSQILGNQIEINQAHQINYGNYNTPLKNENEKQQNPNDGNKQHYQTEGNYRSLDVPSQSDTLQSLAYQREKILGELFGKLGTRNKK